MRWEGGIRLGQPGRVEVVVKLVAVLLGNAAIAHSLQATPVSAHEISPAWWGSIAKELPRHETFRT